MQDTTFLREVLKYLCFFIPAFMLIRLWAWIIIRERYLHRTTMSRRLNRSRRKESFYRRLRTGQARPRWSEDQYVLGLTERQFHRHLQRMYRAAGYPDLGNGVWSDYLIQQDRQKKLFRRSSPTVGQGEKVEYLTEQNAFSPLSDRVGEDTKKKEKYEAKLKRLKRIPLNITNLEPTG